MINIHSDFTHLFHKRETRELAGKNRRNWWILIAILSLTFLVIGFANGSLAYLDQKMNNPFIRWVTFAVPAADAKQAARYKRELNVDSLKQQFRYDTIGSFRNYFFTIKYKNKPNKDFVRGRTIELKDRLLNEILTPKNGFSGNSFSDDKDVGLIVTRDFLREFGYSEQDPIILMDMEDAGSSDSTNQSPKSRYVPLFVRAVVNTLPGSNRVAFTPYFFSQRSQYGQQNKSGNPFDPLAHGSNVNERQLIYYLASDDETIQNNFENAIQSFFEQHTEYQSLQPDIFSTENDHTKKGKNICIQFKTAGNDSIERLDAIDHALQTAEQLAPFVTKTNSPYIFARFYEYDLRDYKRDEAGNVQDEIQADYMSIMLNDLGKVRDLRSHILKTYDLEIDISKVEALENYNFVATLTWIISTVLIIFSVLSICLFVSNLLRTHLDKIKMNLGTFKAFGLDKQSLQRIYGSMIFRLLISATAVSFTVAAICGYMGIGRLILKLLGGKLEDGEAYFQPFATPTLFAMAVIVVTVFIVVRQITNKTLSKTPGDLIYDRD